MSLSFIGEAITINAEDDRITAIRPFAASFSQLSPSCLTWTGFPVAITWSPGHCLRPGNSTGSRSELRVKSGL